MYPRGGDRDSAQGAPMKGSSETDYPPSTSDPAGELQRALYRFDSRIGNEEHIYIAGSDARQLLEKFYYGIVIEDAACMYEPLKLSLGSFDHPGRAMPDVGHYRATAEIEIFFPVIPFNPASLCFNSYYLGIKS